MRGKFLKNVSKSGSEIVMANNPVFGGEMSGKLTNQSHVIINYIFYITK